MLIINLLGLGYSNAILTLKRLGLLTAPLTKALFTHKYPESVAKALIVLHREKLFDESYRDQILTSPTSRDILITLLTIIYSVNQTIDSMLEIITQAHKYPEDLLNVLDILSTSYLVTRIMNQPRIEKIIAHPYPNNIAKAISSLEQENLLTYGNFNAILAHDKAHIIAHGLIILYRAKLLKRINREQLINHSDPVSVVESLEILYKAQLLAQNNFSATLAHQHPESVVQGLLTVHRFSPQLTDTLRDIIAYHDDPDSLARLIVNIDNLNLLTPEVEEKLLTATNLDNISRILTNISDYLSSENAQEILNTLLTHPNLEHVNEALENLYSNDHIPHLLSQYDFKLIQLNIFAIISSSNPVSVGRATNILYHAKLLSYSVAEANLRAILSECTCATLILLERVSRHSTLLSGPMAHLNLIKLINSQNQSILSNLDIALCISNQITEPMAQIILNALVSHKHPESVVRAVNTLHEADLLLNEVIQKNLNLILEHPYPNRAARAISMLQRTDLFTGPEAQTYLNAILHPDLEILNALSLIEYCNLLTQSNLLAIIRHSNPYSLHKILFVRSVQILLYDVRGQEYFDALIRHSSTLHRLSDSGDLHSSFEQIIPAQLGKLISLCDQCHPSSETEFHTFTQYINLNIFGQNEITNTSNTYSVSNSKQGFFDKEAAASKEGDLDSRFEVIPTQGPKI